LAVCLSAPLVAAFFNSEMVIPLLRWLSLIFVINSIGSVHITILKRELDYRKKLVPDIGGALLKTIITISLAFNGFGVWSVIWGQLAGLIVSVILAWLVVSWRPQLKIDYGMTRRFLRYGATIMGINTISVMTNNFSYIIVGKVCGMALLGVFSLSFRLPEVVLIGNLWVLSEVFFSMFSMIQKDTEKIREGFLASIRLVSLFATPISLGLILTAEPLILVVYGEQWLEAVPVLRVLAVYAWVHSLGYHAGDVYKAVGRPVVLLYLTIGAAIIDFTSIIVGSQFGLLGIAAGLLAGMILNCAINLFVVFKMVGVTPRAIAGELKSSTYGCFVQMGCIWLVIIFSPETSSPILQLVMMILSGGAGYLLIIWLMEKANILLIFKKLGFAKKLPGNYR